MLLHKTHASPLVYWMCSAPYYYDIARLYLLLGKCASVLSCSQWNELLHTTLAYFSQKQFLCGFVCVWEITTGRSYTEDAKTEITILIFTSVIL